MGMRIHLAIASLLVVATTSSADAISDQESQVFAPAHYGADLAAYQADGWHVALVDVHENVDGNGDVALAITMTRETRATRFTLELEDGGEHVVGYHRTEVAVPAETRVYDDADGLVDSLAKGEVVKLYQECGTWYAHTSEVDVNVDPYAYHVVAAHVRGGAARKRLAKELRDGLAAGLHVTSAIETADADAPTIEITLSGDQGTRTLRAEHDDDGRVVGLEVWTTPLGPIADPIHVNARVLKTLRHAKDVRGLVIESKGDKDVLVGKLEGGGSFAIDLSDLEPTAGDDTCGC